MGIQLGENPWILISLTTLETLFIILPGFISSKIEKKTFKEVMIDMGFKRNKDFFIKLIAGLSFGVLFFFLGSYIIFFFRNILTKTIFGSEFVNQGQEGAISTTPIHPSLIQITILIVFQVIIIGPCEEGFFRGFLIKKLETKMKLTYAIIFSSVCFTIYHVPPFLVPLPTIMTFFGYYFTIGLLLSFIFIYFDYSLIPCSIAHSCLNILILIA